MKTNNLTKRSFLTSMILALTAGFNAMKNGGNSAPLASAPNGYLGGGSPIYIPRRTRFKGYQRENRRFSFNKNR